MPDISKEEFLLIYALLEEAADDFERIDDEREKYRTLMTKIENELT